jgi:hypothetical protein
MVEADIYLRLLPISILDIYKVFEVMLCCLTGIWVHPYINTDNGWPQILEVWLTCGVEMIHFIIVEAHIHLRLLPTSILDM